MREECCDVVRTSKGGWRGHSELGNVAGVTGGRGGAEEMVLSGINSLQIPRDNCVCLPSDLFVNTMFTVCCASPKP